MAWGEDVSRHTEPRMQKPGGEAELALFEEQTFPSLDLQNISYLPLGFVLISFSHSPCHHLLVLPFMTDN